MAHTRILQERDFPHDKKVLLGPIPGFQPNGKEGACRMRILPSGNFGSGSLPFLVIDVCKVGLTRFAPVAPHSRNVYEAAPQQLSLAACRLGGLLHGCLRCNTLPRHRARDPGC